MLRDERYQEMRRKIFDNDFTPEELETAKAAFLSHESVCFNLVDTKQSFLGGKLCEGIPEMIMLPVCLHLPREKELFPNCLLVINTADQKDFNKVAGHTAKERNIERFFHTLPGDNGRVSSKEVVSVENGFDLKNLRRAKLLIDGQDRYLVLRPFSLNRKD